MRSRVSDGIVIILIGLIGLTAAARSLEFVMPESTVMEHSPAAHRAVDESHIAPQQGPAAA